MATFVGDNDKSIPWEFPFGEKGGEAVFFVECEVEVEGLTTFFAVVLDEPEIFVFVRFAASDNMNHIFTILTFFGIMWQVTKDSDGNIYNIYSLIMSPRLFLNL